MNIRLEKKSLKAVLDAGVIPAEELETAFKKAEETQSSFSQLLVSEGLIEESALLEILSKAFGVPVVKLKSMPIEEDIAKRVPVKLAWYYRFFPYGAKDGKLLIAVSRPVDVNFLDEVRFGVGMDVEISFAREKDIEEMLQKHYGVGAEMVDKILMNSPGQGEGSATSSSHMSSEVEDIEKMAESASVIQLVNQIILNAYKRGASDIHLEPFRGKVRLRYRIDGVLHEAPVPNEMKGFYSAMVSRIKIMANLNIVERRLPQDGKARVKTQNQNLDLRISSIPTPHGESLVIRILPSQMIRELDELGFETDQKTVFKELLSRPHGIVFVTGPTGSGKSTTLYAGLSELNKEDKKIITIEDPVEYELEGITQIQVTPEVGLTFAQGLRSVLRHDPDVMMVGEVRDLETADIAIRVALTGHLILSTLHTNDAASGVTRLLDIGVQPYLVASSVVAFMAQRLVRVICPSCKAEDKEVMEEIRSMIRREAGLSDSAGVKVFKGTGCDHCNGTGYFGRRAIYEVLPVLESTRKLIFERASSADILRDARSHGMRSMRENGWKKVLEGITTPDEIIQATPIQEIPQETKSHNLGEAGTDKSDAEEDFGEEHRGEEETELYVNRRAYLRVPVELELKYRVVDVEEEQPENDDEADFFEVKTLDVSANGLSFNIREEISPGTALDMRLKLPGDEIPIECMGRVVRVTKFLDTYSTHKHFNYRTGVTYLAINSTDRLKLEKFCKQQKAA